MPGEAGAIATAISELLKTVRGWFETAPARRNRKAMETAEQAFLKIRDIKIDDIIIRADFGKLADEIRDLKKLGKDFFKYNN